MIFMFGAEFENAWWKHLNFTTGPVISSFSSEYQQRIMNTVQTGGATLLQLLLILGVRCQFKKKN